MRRPAFLADHNFNEAILEGVARIEPRIAVTRLRDVGLQRHPDADVLDWAAQRHLIVLSHDVNTMSADAYTRISRGQPMSGLLMVRQQPIAFGAVIENLVLIWTASDAEEWEGKVLFLPF